MKWENWGKYAKKSKKYSISKAIVNGKPIYTLWKLPNKSLGNYESFNHAKDAALDFDRKESAVFDRDTIKEAGLLKTMGSDYSRKKG